MADVSDVAIRDARPDELDALLELYAHMHESDAPLPPRAQLLAVWRQMLERPGLACLVAESDGELIASLVLQITPNLTRGARPYALIENVVTRSDQRRQGLGKHMLRAALERAYAQGCYKVMLLTGRKDAGIRRFYRDAGFDGDDKHGYVARPPGG